MADIENRNVENRPPDEKEIAKEKMSSEEMVEQETIETPPATAEIDEEKGFLGEMAENIEEDAKIVGGKATEMADMIVDKLKKGLSQAYEAGSKAIDEALPDRPGVLGDRQSRVGN